MVENTIRKELKRNEFPSKENREQVEEQLIRVLQTRFRTGGEYDQVKGIQKFKTKFNRRPNLDKVKDLEKLLSTMAIVKTR